MTPAAVKHILYQHHHSDGWITLAKKQNGQYFQHHYKITEIEDHLSEWLGQDTYLSQNTFYVPQRRIENIRQLRSLYIDTDCYRMGMKPLWVVRQLELEMFRQEIPEPNYILYSGRGFVLNWQIEPVPHTALPLWQAIQNFLYQKLKHLGADANALDAARVFRIAGSINSKNDQLVSIEYRHNYRYTLREIQEEFLPVLRSRLQKTHHEGQQKNKIAHLFNFHTLHYTRLLDLKTLLQIRMYDVENYREIICFLYRYWSSCFLGDPDEALRQTLELNSEFKKPLSNREVERATESADRAWKKWSMETSIDNQYKRAGYNFTNNKLIQMLDISESEQQRMKTIIGIEEKYRRNNQSRTEKRRENGIPTRDEYLLEQKSITDTRILLLQQTIEMNPEASNNELAQLLSVSESYIRKLKKKL